MLLLSCFGHTHLVPSPPFTLLIISQQPKNKSRILKKSLASCLHITQCHSHRSETYVSQCGSFLWGQQNNKPLCSCYLTVRPHSSCLNHSSEGRSRRTSSDNTWEKVGRFTWIRCCLTVLWGCFLWACKSGYFVWELYPHRERSTQQWSFVSWDLPAIILFNGILWDFSICVFFDGGCRIGDSLEVPFKNTNTTRHV